MSLKVQHAQLQVLDLTLHLNLYREGRPLRDTEAVLVRAAQLISTSRVGYRLQVAALAEGISNDELISDALGELLAHNRHPTRLAVALKDCEDDISLEVRFSAVILTTIEQHMFHRLEITDPLGYNLTRSLRRAMHHNSIAAWPHPRPIFVALDKSKDERQGAEQWELSELVSLTSEAYIPKRNALQWLTATLSLVEETRSKKSFVDKLLLEKAFRDAHRNLSSEDLKERLNHKWDDPNLKLTLEKFRQEAILLVEQRIAKYAEKHKIDAVIADTLYHAINDYLADIQDLRSKESEHEYVQGQYQALDRDEYNGQFKSIFHELMKIVTSTYEKYSSDGKGN